MRKRLIWAVIGGLVLPIAGICAAADVAAIRNISIVRDAVMDGAGRREALGYAANPDEAAVAKAVSR